MTYTPDFNVIHLDDSITAVDVKSIGTATQQGGKYASDFYLRTTYKRNKETM